ncbi:MAG TPA: peptidogalycan biosysnthesis protein, partial [Paenirhodobacter sp.]
MTDAIEITLAAAVRDIPEADWNACACPESADGQRATYPFTTYAFLTALEASGSVGEGTGWMPRPMVAMQNGQVIAVAPVYLKSHSQGEYVFDQGWADAFERAGGAYYPKLQCAVPFS